MKTLCILLLLGIAAVLTGCSEPEEPDSIEYFSQTDVSAHHCEGAAFCGQFYVANVSDNDGSPGWYWLAFERNDSILYAGDGKYVTEPNNVFSCTLQYYYWAYIQPDSLFYDCDLMVYRSDLKADVGNRSKRTSSGGPLDATLVNQPISGCETCCCTGEHFYAQAVQLAQNGVYGARADVTPRYGQICDPYNDSTVLKGHQNAMVSVRTEEAGGAYAYAEIGFYKGPSPFPGQSYFGLMQVTGYGDGRPGGGDQAQRVPSIYPDSLSSHNFALTYNDSDGSWSFFYDGSELNPLPDTFGVWLGQVGDYAVWMGEVFGHESDMPGTNQNKCYFDNCEIFDGQNWYPSELENQYPWGPCIVESDDLSEWMIFVTDSASFFIYDVNPLP